MIEFNKNNIDKIYDKLNNTIMLQIARKYEKVLSEAFLSGDERALGLVERENIYKFNAYATMLQRVSDRLKIKENDIILKREHNLAKKKKQEDKILDKEIKKLIKAILKYTKPLPKPKKKIKKKIVKKQELPTKIKNIEIIPKPKKKRKKIVKKQELPTKIKNIEIIPKPKKKRKKREYDINKPINKPEKKKAKYNKYYTPVNLNKSKMFKYKYIIDNKEYNKLSEASKDFLGLNIRSVGTKFIIEKSNTITYKNIIIKRILRKQ